MSARAPTFDPISPALRSTRWRPETVNRGNPTDIKRDPAAPTIGLSWKIVAAAVAAGAWFVLAAIVFYGTGDPADDYLLWIVGGFAAGFFGLTLSLARCAADDPRYAQGGEGTIDATQANVAIATGVVHAREAMVQLLTIPVALAVGATLIGIAFLALR